MAKYDPIIGEDGVLGGGAFGRVDKVRRKWDQKVFACKTIVYDGKSRSERLAKREFEILARLNSPNIVRYVDAQWEPRQAKLYMEMCEARSLDQLIGQYARRGTRVQEDYVWSIIYQLSNALSYCHHGRKSPIEDSNSASSEWTATILHRDIKPGNVFLSSTSEIALDAIKLGDFGLGVILCQGLDPSTYVGTRKYMPPEISSANIGPNIWTSKCDIFSLGCTLYELCALVSPFEDHMESEHEEVIPVSDEFSSEVRVLISTCMSFGPKDRPDALEILETAQTKMWDNAEYKTAFLNFQLLQAVEKGDLENVLSLLENGAQIGTKAGTDGEGVLHRAAKSNNAALFPLLLAKGAKLSMQDQNGETPLHCAAAVGFGSAVRLLLNEGALIGSVDRRGWTAVHTAASNDRSEVVEMLLEEGNTIRTIDDMTINQKQLTPLHIAALNDCEATLKYLLDAGANIEALMGDGGVALHSAAENGHIKILNILLEKGAKVGVKDQRKDKATALHLAASGGHTAAVKILLEKGANIESKNVHGETPLLSAALYGHEQVIQLLITERADIQARTTKGGKSGWTALHLASEAGHEIVVETLLSLKLDVNARTWDQETSLHWAVSRGHKAVVLALLKHGANICMKGPNQSTPLHWAATSGQLDMTQLLIEKGAKLEEKTGGGETALLLAALYGRTAVLQQLIESGAAIQASNRNGETALHLASRNGKEKVVTLLLGKGANVKAKNGSRQTPLQAISKIKDLAEGSQGAAIMEMLTEASN